MTIKEIKAKQYGRLNTIVPDSHARHLIRMEEYLLVTEHELNELSNIK